MRRDLMSRLLDLEARSASQTPGACKLDLSFLNKDERNRLRTILMRVKDLPETEDRLNALTPAERAWLTQLGHTD